MHKLRCQHKKHTHTLNEYVSHKHGKIVNAFDVRSVLNALDPLAPPFSWATETDENSSSGGGSMSSAGGSMKDYLNSSGHSISEMMVSVSELEAGLKDDIPDSNNTNSGGDGGIEFNNSGGNSMASGDHHLGLGELGTDVKPEVRDGSVEMTNTASSKWGGKDWKKRYMKIDGRTGEVCIYNHKDDGMCIHILKCANLQTVAPYNKRGGDGKRFNMTTVNDETFKFRCATDAEGVAWVTSLNDWKDYALMNMISE